MRCPVRSFAGGFPRTYQLSYGTSLTRVSPPLFTDIDGLRTFLFREVSTSGSGPPPVGNIKALRCPCNYFFSPILFNSHSSRKLDCSSPPSPLHIFPSSLLCPSVVDFFLACLTVFRLENEHTNSLSPPVVFWPSASDLEVRAVPLFSRRLFLTFLFSMFASRFCVRARLTVLLTRIGRGDIPLVLAPPGGDGFGPVPSLTARRTFLVFLPVELTFPCLNR